MERWTEKEVNLLKKNINEEYSILAKLILEQSICAIIGKKDRLKLKRKSEHYWSNKEDKYLIINYPKKTIQELSKKLNKTYGAIYARRIRLIKRGNFIKNKKEFFSKYWKLQYKINKPLIIKHQKAMNSLWKNKSFRKKHKNSIQNMFKNSEFFEAHKTAFLERRNSNPFKRKQEKIVSKMMKLRHKNIIEHKKILMNLKRNPSNQQLCAYYYTKEKLKEKVICSDWTILSNLMEIDIAIPKLKIAIE